MIQPSPLQAREFFSGVWSGEGEVRFVRLAGWLRRRDRFRYQTTVHWITQARGEFTDVFAFESGRRLETHFLSEVIDESTLHVSSKDMPGGADIHLSQNGYTYSPYVVMTRVGPFRIPLHCTDVNVVDREGVISDRVEMRLFGLRVAVLTMTIRVDRGVPNG